MPHDNRPIGIFDSGLGGLTVVAAIKEALPHESIVYLGDTARVPYGNKSVESITTFGLNNTAFLSTKNVKLVVIACNSVSAVAIDTIRENNPNIPIIGVIEAGVTACIELNPSHVTITGTRATINSAIYEKSITQANCEITTSSTPCPLFVPLAEEGISTGPIVQEVIKLYLPHLEHTTQEQLLLLGCTHYPLLKEALSKFANNKVTIIDSAHACAKFTHTYLRDKSLLCNTVNKQSIQFFVTDKPAEFRAQSSRFFGHTIDTINSVVLCS